MSAASWKVQVRGTPNTISINATYGFSKGQHPINKMKIKFENFSGACVRAMMAVMKQADKTELLFQAENLVDHEWVIPLMNQRHFNIFQLKFQKLGNAPSDGW